MPTPKSILVVDDDPSIHPLVGAMLSDLPDGIDWRVDGAPGGEAALETLQSNSYDVILTDIQMPGVDGLALLRHIRDVRPDAKVLVMTAYNSPTGIIHSLRGQANGYLRKPFTQDALLDVLNQALQSRIEPDDIEVLSDKPNWISIRVRCKLETADRLTQFVRELPHGDLPDLDSVAIAFRELLLNAIEHGCRFDPQQKVELSYFRLARSIVYYLRDPGEGFSWDALSHAAISNPPESPLDHVEKRRELGMRPGGFGLLLTRSFADELLYNAKGNEVILVKYLDARSPNGVW